MKYELYPFQVEGADFLEKRDKAMLCDQQGVGKTATFIETCNRWNSKKILVICPSTLRINIAREFDIWSPSKRVRVLEKLTDRYGESDNVVICSYDYARRPENIKHLVSYRADTLILDEAHALKNWTSKQTQFIVKYLALKIDKVLFVTGTPITKSVMDLHPLLCVCQNQITSYSTFGSTYSNPYWDGFSTKYRGYKNEKKLTKLLKKYMIRRFKKDVAPQLPPKIYTTHDIKVTSKIAKASLELLDVVENASEEHDEVVAPSLMEKYRDLGIAKVPEAIKYITDLAEGSDTPIIVFAHHKDVMTGLIDGLKKKKFKVGSIRGGDSGEDKQAVVDAVQANKLDIAVLSITAANAGITLTTSSTMVFVELTWSPGIIEQATDRFHRIGQYAECVNIHYILAKDSVDKRILKILKEKLKVINNIL